MHTAAFYLCLDQGGHASRALILDAAGGVVARATREVATHRSAELVEQDAEEVVGSLIEVAREALAAPGVPAAVAAAGLATQRSSIVCWDRRTGAALSPVISWQDRRADAWLTQFAPRAREIERRTGLRLSAHYGASKLRWCLENLEPVRAARRRHDLAIGPLASFLAFRLSDRHVFAVDPSNAQRTLLWNLAACDWDAALLEAFGVPRELLPACVPTHCAFGDLQFDKTAIPITVLIGDQSAALFAFGAPQSDTAYVNLGTGAFVQRVLAKPHRVPDLLTSVVLHDGERGIYTLEATVNGAGAALAWAAQALRLPDLQEQLSDWISRAGDPPLFLNGIGGLGAPYWRADFPSQFIGTGASWEKAVAVAESIVFLLAENIERMQRATGPLRRLLATGGLARCDGLCQRLADVTGLPVWRAEEHEATARGLAWLLAGHPPTWPSITGEEFMPVVHPAVQARYARWRAEMVRIAPA